MQAQRRVGEKMEVELLSRYFSTVELNEEKIKK